jgi:microcystin-dependent protein
MAVIQGYTKEFVDDVIAATVVGAHITGDDLILELQGGGTVNAGDVRGPTGDTGPATDWEVGDIKASMRSSCTGFLKLDGATYTRATYDALADFLGIPDANPTFQVPDWRNRVPLGAGGSIAAAVGNTGGAATHTLTEAQLPAGMAVNTENESNGHIHNFEGDTDGGGAHTPEVVQIADSPVYQFVIGPVGASTLYLNSGLADDWDGTAVTFTDPDTVVMDVVGHHIHAILEQPTSAASAGHTHVVELPGSGQAQAVHRHQLLHQVLT